jgi:hypothetical protein
MYIKLDCHQFADRMAEHFSRDAAMAIFFYFNELECEGVPPMEFNRVKIRCQFSEYGSAIEAATAHGWSSTPEPEGENNQFALEWLRDRTTVIEFEGGVIVEHF